MKLDADLAAFLASPVMIIIGTSDDSGRPEIARAVGARIDADHGVVELVVSAWQWPATVADLRNRGRIAVTFARPSDYVSYQVKGAARIRPAGAEDLGLAARYMESIVEVLAGLGLDRRLAAPWITAREAVVARIRVEAVYVQTPGARAGQELATP
jgi:predicted pyridoxine 5'-phosphate oxidase superfamily flavin-nucleotide-binding protein